MGDKSPKSLHKKSSQKNTKDNRAAEKKKNIVASKQVGGKGK